MKATPAAFRPNRASEGLNRRQFLRHTATGVVSVALSRAALAAPAAPAGSAAGRITLCLTPGSIGVSANQKEAIELAARFGFEAVEPFGSQLARMTPAQAGEVVARLRELRLQWGAESLTVEFRKDEAEFRSGLAELPTIAAALARAGVTRVGTWLMPCHASLTYRANFHQHGQRLRQVAGILKDHGLRLGLEYVGTQTLRNGRKYPFVHTLAETRELIAEIGTGNVGLVLDTWHWWTAGDSAAELLALTDADIISVDLNDAPTGIPRENQIDGRRELPAATGVIDAASFLAALAKIGYNGPARAEPFNKALNELDNEAACAAVATAMRRVLGRPAQG